MPSCIYVNKRGSIRVGDSAYNTMKSDKRHATKGWKEGASVTYVEFKRTMATDVLYQCSNLNKNFTSEELSAEVLKTLKSFVADEKFNSVVITVPAKFTVNQKSATIQAAKLAGFSRCELLQEPIAASMAYGLTTENKNGMWMVFDFGGGTFDAALIKVEEGIMQVFDTEGDNYLGGKNLDFAIVDDIIIPYLKANFAIDKILADTEKKEILREAMKTYAEEAKIQLSFKDQEDIISNLGDLGNDDSGEETELDLTLTQAQAFEVMRPYFQKAVDICKNLLKRNNLDGSQLSKLILVGGPTHCPLIRQMLKEQITPNVDTSIDPMTAVATGAALYASTINNDASDEDLKLDTVKLNIDYPATTIEDTVYASVSLDGNSYVSSSFVEFVRADKSWSSGRLEIDTKGDVVELNLIEGRANSFSINCYDSADNDISCFPNEITIIQGTAVGAAPLPYFIGIEVWNSDKNKLVFDPIEGLEKNKPLPATGVMNGYKTTSQLRPGNADDKLIIPVYQADESEVGMSSKLYEYVADVVIDGSEVDSLIPEGASVDLTIRANSSEMMTVEAYFPTQDLTISKELKTGIGRDQTLSEVEKSIKSNFVEADRLINSLESDGIDVSDLRDKLNEVKTENDNNSEPKMVLKHQRDVMREIEKLDACTEFDRVETDLKQVFKMTEEDQKKYGGFKTGQVLEQLRTMVDDAIAKKDTKMAKDVLEQVRALDYKLAMIEYYEAWILKWNKHFDLIAWRDKTRARQLLNQAIAILNDSPTTEKLHPYVHQLFGLLPPSEVPVGADGRLTKGR